MAKVGAELAHRLAQLEWPLPMTIVSLGGSNAPWLKKLRRLAVGVLLETQASLADAARRTWCR